MYSGIEKRHLARLSVILWAPSWETLRYELIKFGEILSVRKQKDNSELNFLNFFRNKSVETRR
ncbi:hypothetical protein A3A95_02850 [Candidatus Nomurabacteria bacterium RIFCSPLOWO2_01_FULL_39_18]|nr:MAG: hypothetical protein A3A95_02850 [Candidatus Nomurabacteria bacterium RIFCSPLOWO2_01_FULL_39_18]